MNLLLKNMSKYWGRNKKEKNELQKQRRDLKN